MQGASSLFLNAIVKNNTLQLTLEKEPIVISRKLKDHIFQNLRNNDNLSPSLTYLKGISTLLDPVKLYYQHIGDFNPFSKLLYTSMSSKFDVSEGTLGQAMQEIERTQQPVVYCDLFPCWAPPDISRDSYRSECINYVHVDIPKFRKMGGVYVYMWNDAFQVEHPFLELEKQKNQSLHDLSDITHLFNFETTKVLRKFYTLSLNKMLFARHGEYEKYYPNIISRPEARIKLGISVDKTVISFLSNIRRYKQTHIFVDAMEKFNSAENILFLITGGHIGFEYETYYKPLVNRIKRIKNAKFVDGVCPGDQLQDYYNSSDFIVFAQHEDMMSSGSVMLALNFGIPVIVPDIPAFEFLKERECSVFYQANNCESLAARIMEAASMSKALREEKIKDAFVVSRKFTWRNSSSFFESNLIKCIEARASVTPPITYFPRNIRIQFRPQSFMRLIKGFSYPEQDGTWSNGSDSQMSLFFSQSQGPRVISIDMKGFVSEKNPYVALSAYDETKNIIGSLKFDSQNRIQRFRATVDPAEGLYKIYFQYEMAKSPSDLQMWDDKRILAVQFMNICLSDEL
ncbi:MAG: glycosyltransferase [Alphaproteobacteria bacterium]|nr:glycosyltransferase [Alphaproteobacteria bacterium]